MTMPTVDQVAAVTLFIFVAGLVYDSGRKSERLDNLRQDVDELKQSLAGLHAGIEQIKGMIRGEIN